MHEGINMGNVGDAKFGIGGEPILEQEKELSRKELNKLAEAFLSSVELEEEIKNTKTRLEKFKKFIEEIEKRGNNEDAEVEEYVANLKEAMQSIVGDLSSLTEDYEKVRSIVEKYDGGKRNVLN